MLTPAQLATTGGVQPMVEQSPAIRVSAGVGVSWKSPVGPIRLDLAYPIRKEAFDKTQIFRVSFGTNSDVAIGVSDFRRCLLAVPVRPWPAAALAQAPPAPRRPAPAPAGRHRRLPPPPRRRPPMPPDGHGGRCSGAAAEFEGGQDGARPDRAEARRIHQGISHQEETLRAERDALQRQQASLSAGRVQPKGPRVSAESQ